MKEFAVIILSILIIQANLLSQSCLPDGITFNTQAQVVSFQINFPDCTEIEGDMTISGVDITNLTTLNVHPN